MSSTPIRMPMVTPQMCIKQNESGEMSIDQIMDMKLKQLAIEKQEKMKNTASSLSKISEPLAPVFSEIKTLGTFKRGEIYTEEEDTMREKRRSSTNKRTLYTGKHIHK